MAAINDQLVTYLEALYIPGTFPAADLHTLIAHHLTTLTGDYSTRWNTMIAAAQA